jgi:hypothetical protein
MAYAHYSNDQVNEHNKLEYISGSFIEKSHGKTFEYGRRVYDYSNGFAPLSDFPHIVFVGDRSFRYAKVKKTVVYIVVDEDDNGNPVVEKWDIKNHRVYVE